MEVPAVTDIVCSGVGSGGFKWNCYEGAEAESRSQVARIVMASSDLELHVRRIGSGDRE